jgi:hypothetical protein
MGRNDVTCATALQIIIPSSRSSLWIGTGSLSSDESLALGNSCSWIWMEYWKNEFILMFSTVIYPITIWFGHFS